MSTAGSNLQACALTRSRLTRRRLPRRAQLGQLADEHGPGWAAWTNYGVIVIGSTEARVAAHLDEARVVILFALDGEPVTEWAFDDGVGTL